MKCPKCGYARKMGEAAPDWQCPSCGIAYAKAEAAMSGAGRVRRPAGSGSSLIGKFVVAVFMVAVVWALVPGMRQGSGPVPQGGVANASIVMYSLTTCGYCNAKRAQLHAQGIPFVEYFLDKEPDRQRELFEKLIASGYRGGGIGTPTFEVNGKMLPNNPSLDTIIKNL
jgi:glutaredoxin